MMGLLGYVIPFAVALGVLILFHELGHYLVARWCGVKVLRFSLGFGRPLLMYRAGADATEWVLAAFPLGGYVKMLDEREGEVAEAELPRAFSRQSVWRRFAIVAAGPLANLLLAVVIFWGVGMAGSQELRPVLSPQGTDTPAARAGVAQRDLVLTINDEAVQSWKDLRWAILRAALNQREVVLRVRTLEGNEALRRLDLSDFSLDAAGVDPIAKIGLRPWFPPFPAIVDKLEEGAAAQAGLLVGDHIIAVDGEPVESWGEVVEIVQASAGQARAFTVRRDGRELNFTVTPADVVENDKHIGRIGVWPRKPEGAQDLFGEVRYGFGDAFTHAVRQTWEMSVVTVQAIGQMIVGKVSVKNISGPITIADFAGQSARLGFAHYLSYLAIISISLGVLNLFPVPVLDGGHLLYYAAEIVKGGPLPERVQEIGQQIGLALLLMLMVLAVYNDINRLVSG
ncbi:zinc metalloprotease [Betaproteobacteria bacterium]|nr:zinc metalloprotease [Betaproteobacteria bacterium]GHU13581.1 zinc metalloprotease [Betaproteobacteria bacterium]GHU23197.1 zinc metalloprotease [Betaproteobacteria bacterium]